MSKCAKCNVVFVASDIVAKCVDCKSTFHPACTRAGSAQNFTKNRNKEWKCDTCKEEVNSTASNRSVDEDKPSILAAIAALKGDFAALKGEIVDIIDSRIGEVTKSISELSDGLKELKTQIGSLDNKQCELERRCDKVEEENVQLQDEVRSLKMRVLDAEQHSRSANIEIDGIPFTKGEDVYQLLEKTARVINVPFSAGDVSIAHRLRLYSRKHSHPPVIAQFASRRVREMWLSASRAKRTLLASELASSFPDTRVFINEHLTPDNKMLLGRARRLRREGKLHYAGFANGKVLVRRREGDEAVRVLALQDLEQFTK